MNIHREKRAALSKDFNRVTAKRAMERKPELREIRNNAYKEFFNKRKNLFFIPVGKQKRDAANYADEKVLLHLEGLEERSF